MPHTCTMSLLSSQAWTLQALDQNVSATHTEPLANPPAAHHVQLPGIGFRAQRLHQTNISIQIVCRPSFGLPVTPSTTQGTLDLSACQTQTEFNALHLVTSRDTGSMQLCSRCTVAGNWIHSSYNLRTTERVTRTAIYSVPHTSCLQLCRHL